MPLFTGTDVQRRLDNALTAGLAQVLFPVVLLLGLTGLLVGILQSYDEFTVPAIAPAVWNLVILVVADRAPAAASTARSDLRLRDRVAGRDRRAVADGRLGAAADRLPPPVRGRLARPAGRAGVQLMLPVTIGLGIVNLDQLLNSVFGTLVSDPGAARDRQRVPHLHAAAGRVQRRAGDGPVPDAQPAGGAPRRRRDAPRGRRTGCARSTCC